MPAFDGTKDRQMVKFRCRLPSCDVLSHHGATGHRREVARALVFETHDRAYTRLQGSNSSGQQFGGAMHHLMAAIIGYRSGKKRPRNRKDEAESVADGTIKRKDGQVAEEDSSDVQADGRKRHDRS